MVLAVPGCAVFGLFHNCCSMLRQVAQTGQFPSNATAVFPQGQQRRAGVFDFGFFAVIGVLWLRRVVPGCRACGAVSRQVPPGPQR